MENIMNDFNVKKKLIIIYVFCVIIPLVLTDSIILYILYDVEKKEQLHESENLANAVKYNLEYTFEEVVKEMNDIYVDSEINSFLNENYRDGYAFFAVGGFIIIDLL